MSDSKLGKHVDTLQFLVRYIRLCVTFVAFCSTMMFVVNPQQSQFVYSSFTKKSRESHPKWFPDFILLSVFEYYHKLTVQSVLVVETQSVLVMYIMFSSWILSRIQ